MHASRRRPAFWLSAAMVIALSGCGPSQSASPSPATSPGPSPDVSLLPTGVPTAPASPVPSPVAETPITPTSDEVIVQVDVMVTDFGSRAPMLLLYRDGSLLDLRSSPRPRVWALSEAGLKEVLARLAASKLFTTTHEIPLASPPAADFAVYTVTLATGPSPVAVSAANAAADAESRALVALAEGLLDPAAWLPSSAFVGSPVSHPYLARSSMVTSEVAALEPGSWTNPAQQIARMSWPLGLPPSELGQPISVAGSPGRHLRCDVITGAEEAVIRTALTPFVSRVSGDDQRTSSWDLWMDGPALLRLTLRSFLPNESADCAASLLPGAPSLAEAPRPSLAALLAASDGGLTPTTEGIEMFVQAIRSTDGATLARVSYFADGTVVFRDPPPPAVGLGALRLSAAGVTDLRGRLDASGLVRASYNESVPEGSTYTMFSLVRGKVILNATDRGKDPKASAIAELVRHLLNPAAWLPAADWVGDPTTMRPFLPPSVRLDISHDGAPPDPSTAPLAGFRWPLSGTIDTFGTLDEGGNEAVPGSNPRWGIVPVADARAVLDALAAAGADCWGALTNAECLLAEPDGVRKFSLSITVGGEWGL